MLQFAIKRLLSTIPVLWIAITVCFFILRLAPGGPFDGERPLPEAVKQNLEAHYNLDKPLVQQYFMYVSDLLRGDLGPSFINQDFTVTEQLLTGLPYTLIVGGLAFSLAIIVGVGTGIISSLYRDSLSDMALGALILTGLVVPNFLVAPIFQLVFGLQLKWLPVGGWGSGTVSHLVLPVTVLALPHAARISRLTRAALIDVLHSNFIRTARSKGLSQARLLLKHALKPAMTPVVSYLGPAASFLLTGSLVVETVFGLPGIGRYFINAALNRDYGMVLGTVVFYMVLIIALNLLVDIIYAWLDPRVRAK